MLGNVNEPKAVSGYSLAALPNVVGFEIISLKLNGAGACPFLKPASYPLGVAGCLNLPCPKVRSFNLPLKPKLPGENVLAPLNP